MIVIALVVALVGVLLGVVGRRFEQSAKASGASAARHGSGEAKEVERMYRRQARLLYVVAAASFVLAVLTLLAAV